MNKDTLLSYMPKYYRKSKVINNINNSNFIELNNLYNRLNSVLNQFFIDSADFSLEKWEKELGIEVNNNYNTDFRRSRIISKLRGQGTVTVKLIKNVAESFSNGEVDVIEDNHNYSFKVKFIGTRGLPPNLDDFKNSIEDIKPAHLSCIFEFTWLTFDEFENYNKTVDEWDAINLTWDKFEKYREVI